MNGSEGIFRVSVDVYPFSCCDLSTCVRVTTSAFCAEVPSSSRWWASVAESRVTTASPAGKHVPSWLKMLPSVNYSMSGWPVG
jgi:hypothetical protein